MEVTVLLVIIMTTTKRKYLNCKRTQYSHRLTCECQIVGNIYSNNSNSLMYITNAEEYKRNVVSPLKRCFYTCPSWLLFIEMYHLTRSISNSGPKNIYVFFLNSHYSYFAERLWKKRTYIKYDTIPTEPFTIQRYIIIIDKSLEFEQLSRVVPKYSGSIVFILFKGWYKCLYTHYIYTRHFFCFSSVYNVLNSLYYMLFLLLNTFQPNCKLFNYKTKITTDSHLKQSVYIPFCTAPSIA